MSISVIIPNYNNAAYITQCLRSVANDPAVKEIVVYDNASSDNSVAIVEELKYPKVQVIRGSMNLGTSRARHLAITKSTQPFISFLDGDDYVAEKTLSACLERAIAEDLDMAIPNMIMVREDGSEPVVFIPAPTSTLTGAEGLFLTIGKWELAASVGVLRRSIYEAAASGFAFFGYSDDELLSRHSLLASRRIGGAAGAYFYRMGVRTPTIHQKSMKLVTQTRTLALAIAQKDSKWEPRLRASRNQIVSQMVSLARQGPGKEERLLLGEVLRELDAVKVPWRPRDYIHYGAFALLRAWTRSGA